MLKSKKTIINSFLIKQLPKATAFVNLSMEIVHVSDKWITDFGFISDSVLGKSIDELFQKPNKNWRNALKKCLKETESKIIKEEYKDSLGNTKTFEIHAIPWHDTQENVIGTILQIEDITHLIETETKFEKLQLISEQMSLIAKIGFWEYDIENDQIFWCNKTKSIHEVDDDFDPNIDDALNFYKQGHSRNTISMTLSRAIAEEAPYREKLQLVTAKGNEVWIITSGKPSYKDGKFVGFTGTIQDINELYLAEQRQGENEHLLRTLIDNLPLNVFIKDLESRKILVNQSELEWCEAKNEKELLGKDDFAIYDRETAEASRKDDLAVMRNKKPILGREMLCTKKNGDSTTFLTSKIPLIDTDGKAYGLVGISMDISELKQKELELHNLIKVTSSQNEKLINFAHIVSHNLRSHTSNFSMLLSFLVQETTEEERENIIEMLVNSSDNLLETINNLNEVVDINSNLGIQKKRLGLKDRVQTIEQSLKADLVTQKVKLINKVSEKVKVKVVPAYIDSILTNFLTNAIKYQSPERDSHVILSVEREDNYTVLSIEDNGLGMDLDKHGEKIFGMYKTFHNNADSKGIGLYITKNQIEAMNGKVTVESQVDKGTTFKIYFNDED
jgi:PAS domain S-box-containing protein